MGEIGGSASPGAWPTASARDGDPRRAPTKADSPAWERKKARGAVLANGLPSDDLSSAASMWLTPHGMPGMDSKTGRPGAGGEFAAQATQWATPRSTDGEKGGPNQAGSKGDLMLPSMAAQWPTPSAALMNDGESPESWHARAQRLQEKHSNGNGAGMPLTIAAKAWPTPNAHVIEHKRAPPIVDGTRQPTDPQISTADYAVHVFSSRPGPATTDGPTSSPSSPSTPLRLNPLFAEWLMGWPSQWTKAEPSASSASATALWRSRLQSHLSRLLGEQAHSPTELKEAA